jgi:hypothetical protein
MTFFLTHNPISPIVPLSKRELLSLITMIDMRRPGLSPFHREAQSAAEAVWKAAGIL